MASYDMEYHKYADDNQLHAALKFTPGAALGRLSECEPVLARPFSLPVCNPHDRFASHILQSRIMHITQRNFEKKEAQYF